jgi:putative SOS response-associated peptidase YedK
MCGRYVSPTEAEMERYWALSDAQRNNQLGFSQHFNIAPTPQIPIIYPGDEGIEMRLARWGLVPFWWKQPKMPPFTFNARIEEAATKPMWRNVVKTSRCLIPAIGWYEWKEVELTDPVTGEIKKAKQPYFIHLPGRPVFPFAGLMSRWKATENDAAILTAAIITRAAEGPAAEVHTRMPLILPKNAEAAWTDPKQTDGHAALDLAQQTAVTALVHHPVSSRVNNSKSAGADLIEPFPNPA